MKNIQKEIAIISAHRFIDIQDNAIVSVNFWRGLWIYCSHQAKSELITRVCKYAQEILDGISQSDPIEKRVYSFQLIEKIIRKYKNDTALCPQIERIDQLKMRKVAQFWPNHSIKTEEFQLSSNQGYFSKWLKYGFSQNVFIDHPDFACFLIRTQIASAMAMWDQPIKLINNKPHILCDGKFIDWEAVRDAIDVKYHADSRSFRLYDKQSGQFMEYMGLKGLVLCDRFHSDTLPVVSQIDPKELRYLQFLAKQYLRPEETQKPSEEVRKSRDHILQIVTRAQSKKDNIFRKGGHPFFRLISPDGRVKNIGFMKFNNNPNALSHGKGKLGSPDFSDQEGNITQFVTNIAITETEAFAIQQRCEEIQKDSSMAFNFRGQNCTSFIKYILTEFELAKLPGACSVWRLCAGIFLSDKKIFPSIDVSNHLAKQNTVIHSVCKVVQAVFLKTILLLLGERPFYKFSEKNAHANKFIRFFQWLKEPVRIDLPLEIQTWQRHIPSTEKIHKKKKVIFSSIGNRKHSDQRSLNHAPGFGTMVTKTSDPTPVTSIWTRMAKQGDPCNPINWIRFSISKMHSLVFPKRYITSIHPEIIRDNEQAGPKLGEYVKTDIRVMNDNTQSYLFKMQLLKSAKQSIEISFNFAGGEHFDALLRLVRKKMTLYPHFKVHFILSPDLLSNEQLDSLQALKKDFKEQFNCLITQRFLLLAPFIRTEENHAKMIVVDGQYFVVGGSGIHDKMDREVYPSYLKTDALSIIDQTFKDTDIIGYGELAKTIRGQFYNLYQLWAQRTNQTLGSQEGIYMPLDTTHVGKCAVFHEKRGLIKKARMCFLVSGPEHRPANPISKTFENYINRSQKNIQIANLYFNPADNVKRALKRAMKRKVQVIGHFNGIGKDISPVHYNYIFTNRKNYSMLNQVFEHQIPDQCYHKKLATFDQRVAIVGSFNLGQKSALCDHESVVVIEDKRAVAELNQALLVDEMQSKQIRLRDRSISDRLLYSLSEWYGKLDMAIS